MLPRLRDTLIAAQWLLVAWMILAPVPARAAAGDCNGDGTVRISEIITAVAIALGQLPVSRCPAVDADDSGTVSIDELIRSVVAALAPPPSPSPSPTPPYQIIDIGLAGGQPCAFTQATFTIPDGLPVEINALRLELCTDAAAFDVAAVTCSPTGSTVAIDSVEHRDECRLDAPTDRSGQVTVRARGTGGAGGNAFAPFDAIDCRFPVFADTAGGDYALRFVIAAETTEGQVVNAGEALITVFGLPDSGRFDGQCCNADTQCESGFCRAGDDTLPAACCASDCAGHVCNSSFFAGTCCTSNGLPDTCNAP